MSQNIKPQKALHMYLETDKVKSKYIGHEYMMFEKHDGWFGYLDFPSCKIHSRAMREIPAVRELSDSIRAKRGNWQGRLIFEIMIDGLEIDSFHVLNGILNRKNEQADGVYLRVHDFLHEWQFNMPAITRYNFAHEIVTKLDHPDVRISPLLGLSNKPEQWQAQAEKIWEKGGEGLILKRSGASYSAEKRNFELMKIKEELTLDLLVIGMESGATGSKYENTLGKLILRDRAGNEHRVSGMSDAERDEWWKAPDSIVGKVVEVKAMKRLRDGSLREPRYKARRFDKAAEDID